MTGSILKNTGKPAAALLLVALFFIPASAAQVDTVLVKKKISVGGSTTLQLKISDEDVTPVSIPKVPGLEISYQGMQRSFRFINGKTWRGITLNFTITAGKRGTYRIPPFVFESSGKRINSEEVILVVARGTEDIQSGSPSMRGRLLLSGERVHTGEPVIMRYFILTSGVSAGFKGFRAPPQSRGFVIKKIDEAVDDEVVTLNGRDWVQGHIASFILIPAGAGSYNTGGGRALVSMQSGDNFFPFENQRAMSFGTAKLKVVPLPEKGKPGDFRGDVGVFTIDAEYSPDPINVFNEKRIIVTVAGKGNLLTLSRPRLSGKKDGARVLVDEGESSMEIRGNALEGTRRYVYTVIPEKAGTCDMGRISISFFNTDTLQYQTVETGNISFSATGGKTEEKDAAFDRDDSEKVDFNPLYLIGILIIVSGTVLLVVMWERKRYRYVRAEAASDGPDSKPARGEARDYRHELREAIRVKDRGSFLRSADAFLNEIIKGAKETGNSDAGETAGGMRDRIYGFRFGGVSMSDADMEKIMEDLSGLSKGRS